MSADAEMALDARLQHRGLDPERAYELLTEAERGKLSLMLGELGDIETSVRSEPLESNAQAHDLTNVVARASAAAKELTALRRARLRPLEVETASVNDLFRPAVNALEKIVASGKSLLQAWREQERAREQREREAQAAAVARAAEELAAAEAKVLAATGDRERAIALAEAEAKSQNITAAVVAQPREAATAFRSEHGTASGRLEWTHEIVNADLLPREYLQANEAAIKAAVAAGARQIPGVHIFQRESITVRARR